MHHSNLGSRMPIEEDEEERLGPMSKVEMVDCGCRLVSVVIILTTVQEKNLVTCDTVLPSM